MALDVEKCKKRLIEERDRLHQEIGTVADLAQPIPDDLQITAANAPVMGGIKDVQATLAGMRSDRLGQINAALQSIDEGIYGMCQKCGKPINPRRLDAEPQAITCMDCLPAVERNFAVPKM